MLRYNTGERIEVFDLVDVPILGFDGINREHPAMVLEICTDGSTIVQFADTCSTRHVPADLLIFRKSGKDIRFRHEFEAKLLETYDREQQKLRKLLKKTLHRLEVPPTPRGDGQ